MTSHYPKESRLEQWLRLRLTGRAGQTGPRESDEGGTLHDIDYQALNFGSGEPGLLKHAIYKIGGEAFAVKSFTNEIAGFVDPSPGWTLEDIVREWEVLQHVAQGATNAQIATVLFVSEKTVERHVTGILSKLGAVNRVEAAGVLHRLRAAGHQIRDRIHTNSLTSSCPVGYIGNRDLTGSTGDAWLPSGAAQSG